MIRTQIYIDETLHKKLNRLAHAQGRPMAEVVRHFLEEGVSKIEHRSRTGIATLKALATLGFNSANTDVASNVDHYLYGAPKVDDSE